MARLTKNTLPWHRGFPLPLGVSRLENGFNFALFATHVSRLFLAIFHHDRSLFQEVVLSEENRTGDIWHIGCYNLPSHLFYAWRIERGALSTGYFSDPYSRKMVSSSVFGKEELGDVFLSPIAPEREAAEFEWEGDRPLNLPLRELVIYEMHVRSFTNSPTSSVPHRGTFLGIIDKIDHLVDLQINAVELMPVHAFNETSYQRVNPLTGQLLCNYWGYNTLNFFCLMEKYADGDPITEFKTMVKALHAAGIEVILDVVFNHTGKEAPFFAAAPEVYYLKEDYTGCGNSLSCNALPSFELILYALRYFVVEFHVDGFRFDLASCLTRGVKGEPLSAPPLIEGIATDPLLAETKLFVEPWDVGGLYEVGTFHLKSPRFSEWNAEYRDTVRSFMKGDAFKKSDFARRVTGSEDLYSASSPLNSVNLITVHDGFTLQDLCSYNSKHNEENGEENRDGLNYNRSWNLGQEGETKDPAILALRERQKRNFHLTLMVSRGVPLLLMGDEYGHTRRGNNNAWCQDNELNWFLWDKLEQNSAFFRFYKLLIHFRRKRKLLQGDSFFKEDEIDWHGKRPLQQKWDADDRFIAFTIKDIGEKKEGEKREDIYLAFNASNQKTLVTFPLSPKNQLWYWVVNTAALPPADFLDPPLLLESGVYTMLPFSAIMLISR